MRLPGTLRALSEQLEAVGWGTPQELRFDENGNVIGIVLRPQLAQPATGDKAKTAAHGRRSVMETFGRRPMDLA